jgi:Inner membrane protein YgaP-like, transmembrane domain
MTRNMGALDRGARAFLVAPAAIILAFVVGAGTFWGIVLFAVAGIMLATSTTGYCPNYTWLGISTEHGLHRTDHGLFHGQGQLHGHA